MCIGNDEYKSLLSEIDNKKAKEYGVEQAIKCKSFQSSAPTFIAVPFSVSQIEKIDLHVDLNYLYSKLSIEW